VKVLVILNAQAGANASRENSEIRGSIAEAFSENGLAADIQFVEPQLLGEAAKGGLERAKDGDLRAVVVGGGDGTVRSVAGALAGSAVPLGILPLGTLNHFAKDLGIPIELKDAIRIIAEGHSRKVDVAEVNGERFINNSSIGVYPYMVLDRDRRRKLQGGSKWIAMSLALIRVMRSFPRRQIAVRTKAGAGAFNTPCLFVGNNEYGTDVFRLGKRERLDAGELWLYVASVASPWAFFRLARRMAFGSMEVGRDLTVLRVKSAEIVAGVSRIPVSLDGEVEILKTPLNYAILPGALTVYVPSAAEESPSNHTPAPVT
jgi:diacylglycerol kinase family enzyme